MSASQCGSGCESGWTFYLGQSSYSQTRCQNFGGNFDEVYGVKGARFGVEDEEEGLSMVSDASSGPRHYYCQDYVECLDENRSFCSHPVNPEPANKTSKNKKQMKEHCSNNQQHSFLDDTASSPVISFSEVSSTIFSLFLFGWFVTKTRVTMDVFWCFYRRTSTKILQWSCWTFHKAFRVHILRY